MRSLYEGILADIEDTLSTSDDNVALISANMPDSPLRKMFNINNMSEQPFTLNNKELTVSTESSGCGITQNSVHIVADEHNRLSDYIKNVESLKIHVPSVISCKDINKDICKSIISPSICVRAVHAGEINNVRLRAESIGRIKVIPKISIDVTNPKLSNSVLDIDNAVSSNGRLLCLGIPEFKNVSSSSIQVIDCSSTREIVFKAVEKPLDVFVDKKWANLFEFGYTLKYCTGKNYDEATASTVSIKSMKDIKKLVTSKDFYGRIYNEWPYRLKPNVKLSDFIDVSKFDKLERINIYDKRVTVVFEKITGSWAKFNSAYKNAFGDLLKTTWDQMHPEYNKTNINNHIPVTADGWRVIIIRY